jgi:hypothetical protein
LVERGAVAKVQIHFKNDKVMTAEGEIGEDLTKLVVHTGDGEYSVVPLSNVLYYDVEQDCE